MKCQEFYGDTFMEMCVSFWGSLFFDQNFRYQIFRSGYQMNLSLFFLLQHHKTFIKYASRSRSKKRGIWSSCKRIIDFFSCQPLFDVLDLSTLVPDNNPAMMHSFWSNTVRYFTFFSHLNSITFHFEKLDFHRAQRSLSAKSDVLFLTSRKIMNLSPHFLNRFQNVFPK